MLSAWIGFYNRQYDHPMATWHPDTGVRDGLGVVADQQLFVKFFAMKAYEELIYWAEFEARRNALERALDVNDVGVIRLMMQQLVAGYTPSDDIGTQGRSPAAAWSSPCTTPYTVPASAHPCSASTGTPTRMTTPSLTT